jgi:outer membrane receptor for ferrienterochelin and colicin
MRFYDKVILTGGARVDDQHDFAGINTSAHGSLVFLVHPKYTLRTSIATAFNTPTLINYFINFDSPNSIPPVQNVAFRGNRDLKAEKILYIEMDNTIAPIEKLKFHADFFYYRLNNIIINMLSLENITSAVVDYRNDGGAEAIGGEIGVEGDIAGWLTAYANWSYEHFSAINGNTNNIANLGNPKNKVNFGLRGKWLGRLTANLDFHYIQSHQAQYVVVNFPAILFPTQPFADLGDSYLLNARLGFWPIKDHMEIAVSANNILNDNTPQSPSTNPMNNLTLAEIPQFNIWGSIRYIF